jgi:hypothetical protein
MPDFNKSEVIGLQKELERHGLMHRKAMEQISKLKADNEILKYACEAALHRLCFAANLEHVDICQLIEISKVAPILANAIGDQTTDTRYVLDIIEKAVKTRG